MDLLGIASTVIGWAYVVAWSVSLYPPIFLINRLKSVEGVSFDFVFLNLLGYVTYTISQSLLYFSTTVRNEYAQRHSLSKTGELNYPLVRFNDVAYGYHGLATVIYMLYQMYCCGYTRNARQYVGTVTKLIFVLGGLLSVGVVYYELFPPANSQFQMYDVAVLMGNLKVTMSISKYIPQVLWNRRRKSTKGWSIDAIQLDIVGGILSLGQLFLDGYIRGDLKGVLNNSVKLLLAGVSLAGNLVVVTDTKYCLGLMFNSNQITLLFDAIFAFQHYFLYGDREIIDDEKVRRGRWSSKENTAN
jgi:cystinosin